MHRLFALRHFPLHCCFALLAACGGGGDDADDFDTAQHDSDDRVELVDAHPDPGATASGGRFARPICTNTPSAPCGPQPLPTH